MTFSSYCTPTDILVTDSRRHGILGAVINMAYRGQGRGGKDPSSKVFSHSGDPQGGHSNRPLIRHSCCHGFHIGGQTKKAG